MNVMLMMGILIGMIIGAILGQIGVYLANDYRRKHGCYNCYHCGNIWDKIP